MNFLYYQSICKIIIGSNTRKTEWCDVFLKIEVIDEDAIDHSYIWA